VGSGRGRAFAGERWRREQVRRNQSVKTLEAMTHESFPRSRNSVQFILSEDSQSKADQESGAAGEG